MQGWEKGFGLRGQLSCVKIGAKDTTFLKDTTKTVSEHEKSKCVMYRSLFWIWSWISLIRRDLLLLFLVTFFNIRELRNEQWKCVWSYEEKVMLEKYLLKQYIMKLCYNFCPHFPVNICVVYCDIFKYVCRQMWAF